MDIQNRKELKAAARQHLSGAENGAKVTLLYAGFFVLSSLLINGLNLFLGSRISQSGGLQNMGLRSMLSTLKTMVPIVFQFLMLCLSLGFTGAMLRISRGQYTSYQSLRIGFDRFWVLLRATVLQLGFYIMAFMAAQIVSMQIFFLTPLSRKYIALMGSMVQGNPQDVMLMMEDPAFMDQMIGAMLPVAPLLLILFLALAAPIYYRYILTNYILIDKPGMGAMAAMRESRMIMRGNRIHFFKLDLSMWYFYLASLIASMAVYLFALLTILGVAVPLSPLAGSLICFGVHLVLTFLVILLLKPHVEVTHALAYESLRPKGQPSGGVVLGNIFDLAKDQMDQLQQ